MSKNIAYSVLQEGFINQLQYLQALDISCSSMHKGKVDQLISQQDSGPNTTVQEVPVCCLVTIMISMARDPANIWRVVKHTSTEPKLKIFNNNVNRTA